MEAHWGPLMKQLGYKLSTETEKETSRNNPRDAVKDDRPDAHVAVFRILAPFAYHRPSDRGAIALHDNAREMRFRRRIQSAQSRGIAHRRERASLPRLFPERL